MIFEEIKLEWKGEKYAIPEDRVLRCIAAIEDIVTVLELSEMHTTMQFKFAKIAMAYTTMLRMAGAKDVTEKEVHASLYPLEGPVLAKALSSVETMLRLMTPPEYLLRSAEPAKKEAAAKP